MFELSIALKYLIPKRKSLGAALISLMSVVVISSVVWLVLVFLSVTTGLEKNWLKRLTSLHAPLRITPTEDYYSSYYYRIDGLSAASSYTPKTLGEKLSASLSDPYSEEIDAEIPSYWPIPERNSDGQLIDPVKTASQILQQEGLLFQDYEIGGALLRLTVVRPSDHTPSSLSQMSFLISLTEKNPNLASLLLPLSLEDKRQNAPTAVCKDGVCELPDLGEITPVILPKNYRDSGVLIGHRGTLNYTAPGPLAAQDQRIPVQVVGFYDPGVLAVGNKCLIVPAKVTRAIHAAMQTFSPDGTPTNGFFVWFKDLNQTKEIQSRIEKKFAEHKIDQYWKIASYEEFEFAKDLLLQFRSDRTLFLLIAAIILIVACSNIISLLVLLVNDKKREIAILQSLGASFKSIAAIFGACGMALGLLSCLLGTLLATLTLHNLHHLVSFLSAVQGRAAFNPAFFGQNLPNELQPNALLFVLIATPLLSLAAGLIPALKASRIKPSAALRSE